MLPFLACALVVGGVAVSRGFKGRDGVRVEWPTAAVVIEEVERTLLVGGDVESGDKEMLKCELEMLRGPTGRPLQIVILDLVADGTRLKKGDRICRFDSSGYDELLRLGKIELERVRSNERQAELEAGAALAALRAYRDGETLQIEENLKASVALSQAALVRANERLDWSLQMQGINYISADELSRERSTLTRLELDSLKANTALRNHGRYRSPKRVRELEVEVENAEIRVRLSAEHRKQVERYLENIEELIEKCDMKAPNDGMLVYAGAVWGDDAGLGPGKVVFQGMPLFFLPNLDRLAVEAVLHESLIGRVEKGDRARVKISALASEPFEGKVVDVDLLPTDQWRAFNEFKGVIAKIVLDNPPPGLLPGLSAEVEVITEGSHEALLVPVGAIGYDGGRPYCFVAGPDGSVEKRAVELVNGDLNRIEVTSGLAAGERVLLSPGQYKGSWQLPLEATEAGLDRESSPSAPDANCLHRGG